MSKFKSLKYLEVQIQDRVSTLQITEVAQHFNNPNLEIEMCEALLAIFNIVKNVEETRWARTPKKNSNKNLSWIVSSKINPILSKTKDIGGTSLLDYDFVKNSINEKSEKTHIQNLAIFFQKQDYFGDSEKSALAFLSETLFILVAHYSSNEKKHIKSDGPYCLYCFRERYRFDTDTCDKHRNENRTGGKRYLDRYIKMKDAIRSYEYSNNLLIFNSMILKVLRKKEIGAWQDTQDEISWVKEILILIYAYDEKYEYDKKYVEEKVRLLLKESNPDLKEFFPHWPSSLNGTMFRYQAYILAKHRRPTIKIIKKLNQVWSGQKVINVAKKSKVHRSGLQRAVIDWRKKINLLRSEDVPDELIKVALGLKFLPVRKSGGATNKNLPKQI